LCKVSKYPNPCKPFPWQWLFSLSLFPSLASQKLHSPPSLFFPLHAPLSHSPFPLPRNPSPKPHFYPPSSLSHCSLSLGQFLSLAVSLSLRREVLKSPPLSPWSSVSRHSRRGVDRNRGGNLFPPGTFLLRAQFLRILPVSVNWISIELTGFNWVIGFY
jgi:hypothetical protein